MTSGIKCGICLVFPSSTEKDFFVNTLCGHIYHYSCIREWIRVDKNSLSSCPVCRGIIHLKNLVKLHGISPIEYGNDNTNYHLKMVLLGDSGSGKSSLIHSLTKGAFAPNKDATVGCDLCFRSLEIAGKIIKLSIWDCGGQDRFRAITPNYLRNVHGVCIVYDITKPETLDNLNIWLQLVYENAPTDVSIMIIGNKSDLGQWRKIQTQQGQDIAKQYGFEFIETSAKDLTNVEAAFRTMAATILQSFWKEGHLDSFESPMYLTSDSSRSNKCGC